MGSGGLRTGTLGCLGWPVGGVWAEGSPGACQMGPGALAVAGVGHRDPRGKLCWGPPWKTSWSEIRP